MIDITWLRVVELLAVGAGAGFYGTLVGLGGGFIILPVLLLIYHFTPQQTVGTSLTIVFFNAVSGTLAYVRQKRIDYRSGVRFAIATLPGSVLGAYIANYLSFKVFSVVLGALLFGIAVFILLRPKRDDGNSPGLSCAPLLSRVYAVRTVTDNKGRVFRYAYKEWLGILVSFFVGFISSMMGIAGGVVQVPTMVYLFNFPTHVATATSTFILSLSTVTGSAFHQILGHVVYAPALIIGAGAIIGAQGGARVAQRLQGKWIVRSLAVALLFVGGRLLWVLTS